MATDFTFVDGFQPNRAARKIIRSHAMIGKNIGKTLHRPSMLKLIGRQHAKRHSVISPSNAPAMPPAECCRAPNTLFKVPRILTNVLQTVSLPVELPSSSLEVIHHFFVYIMDTMYPLRLGLSVENYKYLWLRVMFTDESSSLCSIALMDACNEFFLGRNPDAPIGLSYLVQALNIVQKRLQGEQALDDSTLSLVISLILQEELRNEQSMANVHYAGLTRMIELRGGLGQLEGNQALLMKVCKMDICYSLRHGSSLSFFRGHMPQGIERARRTLSVRHFGLNPYLYEIFLDAMDFTAAINLQPMPPAIGILTIQETVASICGRLIRFHPLSAPRLVLHTESFYHIGLTIFMMTVFLQYDGRRVCNYPLVISQFQDVLANDGQDTSQNYAGLHFWVMLIGGIWIIDDNRDHWLLHRIRDMIHRLNIDSFDGVLIHVKEFPWIDKLHNEPARSIWTSIQQRA